MAGLPSPPMEDEKSNHARKSGTKQSKPLNRTVKRSSSSHEHGAVLIDGRHKRVWKACERCRMKKTKCDGESPCKRCKDDGLVCTAGSRKKTEFKQLPRGYAEVLENTQYALIATVQKLYTMVRNNESWDLGDPETNGRGQPVIHDIASKLGCIRPSPDLPHVFPEGSEDFAELQVQMQAVQREGHFEDSRRERASSSDSDHSEDNNQILWGQQQRSPAVLSASALNPDILKPTPLNLGQKAKFDEESIYSARPSFENNSSLPSPIYTDFKAESPMLRNSSPFSPWSAKDEFLTAPHPLDGTAQYLRPYPSIPRSSPLSVSGFDINALKVSQLDSMNFDSGPNLLDYDTGFDLQMESIVYNDYGLFS